MDDNVFDVAVVGGSFAGLAAAMQVVRSRRRVLVIDAGEPRNRFAEASHGFLGQDGRPPGDILADARAQFLAYPTAELRHDKAVRAQPLDDAFEVSLAASEPVRARRLVLATGVIDELPAVPGVRERWGRSVLHCPYCHGFEVGGQRLGVLATGEMSVHQALLVADWSPRLVLFTQGLVEPTDEQRAELRARGVAIEPRRVSALLGDAPALAGVRLEDGDTVELDALFTATRTRMASPLAEQLGCAFDEGPFGPVIRVDERKQTTVPGVYAAGDAARVPHSVSLAVGDGMAAGVGAHQSLALAPRAERATIGV